MKISPKDIQYLEEKTTQLPIHSEELYIEMLDHILCAYEASGTEDVHTFWVKEKENWTGWKLFKIRFKHENALSLVFASCFLKSTFSLKQTNLLSILLLFGLSIAICYTYLNQDFIIIPFCLLLVILPILFNAWIYHTKDTFGERTPELKGKGLYSSRRDAFNVLITAHLFGWGIFLFTIKQLNDFESVFNVLTTNPATTTAMLFMLLLANRALLKVYQTKLKPCLYETK
ncbi:hypothetical protein A3SI_13422 [Nitritalea halalkaliphila LW7]|uniref:Uncharacterized protein n=1 Tax=Nitritalea halalkaliphila LW7 TaxID=1189621 RepID=I5C0Q6_9BACT|nr:hypothetical protein [Nitritalea halalkaliphila]EIM75408.1 hypothetical protein A3SI_13422 [Nitritalea halalkaliphila LW7]